MLKILFQISFLIFFNLSYSQNIEKDHIKRVYEINLDGFQKIKLTKTKNNNYRGVIINYTYKHGVFRTRARVSKRTKLKKELTKQLMGSLYKAGMDTLKKINCWKQIRLKKINIKEFSNCMESNDTECLDGDSSYFSIMIGKTLRAYSFNCINPNEVIKSNTPLRRKHALTLLKIINEKIDLKKLSKDFFRNLKKGEYNYYGLSTIQKK